MRKTVDGFKWLSVSVTVASLVVVFWVWPAWNAGPQTWYWGNNQGSINTMYRNAHPPSGFNAPYRFAGELTVPLKANEAANQMLDFGSDYWHYQIEWYRDPAFMGLMTDMVSFELSIGKWSGMNMMYFPYFSAMGSGAPGSMASPFVWKDVALPIMMSNLVFMPGDVLGAMAMFMTNRADLHMIVSLANTCSVTSGLSDPGYPGAGGGIVPTLSQWGTLVLAILLPLVYPLVIKRRIRIGCS